MTFVPLPKAPHRKTLVCSPDVWDTLKAASAQPAFPGVVDAFSGIDTIVTALAPSGFWKLIDKPTRKAPRGVWSGG